MKTWRYFLVEIAATGLAVIFFCLPQPTQAQRVKRQIALNGHLIKISEWKMEDGLPFWGISDMIQDRKGRLWLFGPKGLCCFDGRQFKYYDEKHGGIPRQPPIFLAEDVNGRIWLVYEMDAGKAGIRVFDPQREQTLTFEEYTGRAQPPMLAYASRFCRIPGGIYYTHSQGAWYYDGSFRELARPTAKDGHFLPGPGEKVWHWTRRDSLHLLDTTGRSLLSLPAAQLGFLQPDEEGGLWSFPDPVAPPPYPFFRISENGIDTFPPHLALPFPAGNSRNDYRPLPVFTANGYRIYLDQENRYALYFQEQMLIPSLEDWLLEKYQIKLNSIHFFFLGEPGVLWASTVGGLLRLECLQNPFTHYLDQTYLSTSVRSITSAGPFGTAACTYRGAFLLEEDERAFRPLSIPSNSVPISLLHLGNNLWIGTHDSRLYRYDLKNDQYREYGEADQKRAKDIYALALLPDSSILAGCRTGLWRLDAQQKKLTPFALPDTIIYFFHQDHREDLWIGTEFGLMHWNTRRLYSFPQSGQENSPPAAVYHLKPGQQGDFWIATHRGLVRWTPFSKDYNWYTSDDGLPRGRLHAVYPDRSGALWISSNHGLAHFDPASGRCTIFGESDGLTHSEFNFLAHHRDASGRLFFGSINGITSFHPEDISFPGASSPGPGDMFLESIYFPGTDIPAKLSPHDSIPENISIPSEIREVRLHFSYPCFDQTPLKFEWRLKGAEGEWQSSDDLMVQLYKILYGKNRLDVRIFPEGNPHKLLSTASLTIYGQRPFYLRGYFFLGAGLLLLGLLWVGIRWREKAIRARNRTLRLKIEERTAELKQKTEKLQQLMETKDQLFTNISHEFRTPLSLILGHSRLLQKDMEGRKEQANHLSAIRNQSLQMKEMTEEILDLARLQTSEVKVMPTLCEWPDFLKQLWSPFTPQAEGKKLTYLLQVDEKEERLLFLDKQKVSRVVNNLIGNALKYTPSGGKVSVRGELHNDTLCISVQDTGPGISAEELPHIFDRYFQGRGGEKGGFGIGLSLSKAYAELMGGTLEVKSKEGQGSCFHFRIPVAEAVVPDAPEPEIPVAIPLSPAPNLPFPERPHLLVVEDNEALLQFLIKLLGGKYNISPARNGREALEILWQKPDVDLVVSDIMMPVMDGFGLLSNVRKDPRLESLPFLLLTAMTEKQARKQAYVLGVDGFLPKPFEVEELTVRIESLLKNLATRRSAPIASPQKEEEEPEALPSFDQVWLQDLQEIVQRRLSDTHFKIGDLAQAMNISERTLRSRLKSYTGLTPSQYMQKARLEKAFHYLQNRRYATVAEVCYAVGLQNTAHFARIFKKEYGKLPSAYLK